MSLSAELKRWDAMPSGHVASSTDLAMLITHAECATAEEVTDAWPWKALAKAVHDHGGFPGSPKEVSKRINQEVCSARFKADLGLYPKNPEHFARLFVTSRKIRLTFAGQFFVGGQERPAQYVHNMVRLCCNTHSLRPEVYLTALANWQMDEQPRLLEEAYQAIRFESGLDDGWSELTKFADLLVADTGDAAITVRNRRGAVIALAQFVWRVKNHMRRTWQHKAHLMPVLYGPTGSGKTTAVNHLLRPLTGMHMDVGFDLLDDNSKCYDLSIIPVMVFEEMAGASRSDVNKIKAIMHTEHKQMRQAYETATVRTLMSTFFGCSNKDISDTIKDETSNRRFFQITVTHVDLNALKSINPITIWKSVNEDAEAPMYASKADLDIINDIQTEQRHLGVVEQWLMEASLGSQKHKATTLFRDHFHPWCEEHDPMAAKTWNATRLGTELARLADMPHWRGKIEVKSVHKSNSYTFVGAPEVPRGGQAQKACGQWWKKWGASTHLTPAEHAQGQLSGAIGKVWGANPPP